jgi:hypothetical protein
MSQIGVRYMSAIVDEWMACDLGTEKPQYDIDGWWPSPEKPPVLIFSTKRLDLEPKGPATDRAIANVAVKGIASYLMVEAAHDKPPRDCPNYYNSQQKLEVLTGRQQFCKPCADKLRQAHPEEFTALNLILAAFD